MTWEFQTITVYRRYHNRDRDYVWVCGAQERVLGWETILAAEAQDGWELVSAAVECSEIQNSRTDTCGYRLFFKRPVRA